MLTESDRITLSLKLFYVLQYYKGSVGAHPAVYNSHM